MPAIDPSWFFRGPTAADFFSRTFSFQSTTTYNPTGTGALHFAGSGTATVSVSATGTGALHFAGAGTATVKVVASGTGALSFTGSGTGAIHVLASGTGTLSFAGTGTATGTGGTPALAVSSTGGAVASVFEPNIAHILIDIEDDDELALLLAL